MAFLRQGQVTPKPKGDTYRPILLSSIIRRLATKALMIGEKEAVANLTHNRQYGVGREDGSGKLTKLLRTLVDQDPSRHVISLDIKAAFQTVSRSAIAKGLEPHPVAAQAFRAWYPHNTTTSHRVQLADGTFRRISANRGVDQGDPLAAYGFSKGEEASLDDLEADIQALHRSNRLLVYLDDAYVVCRPEDASEAIRLAAHHLAAVEQELQVDKIKLWSQHPLPLDQYPPHLQPNLVRDLKCLGTYLRISGDADNTDVHLSDPAHPFATPMQRLQAITQNIQTLQQHGLKRQTAITLLHNYTTSAAQHIVRNYFVATAQAAEWDSAVRQAWQAVLDRPIPRSAPGTLPRKLGGLAISDLEIRHHAAIWSAWTGSLQHIVANTPGFNSVEDFLDACPSLANALEATQQGLAHTMDCSALGHKPLNQALGSHTKQKQYMARIHKRLHQSHLNNIPTDAKALLHSQSSSGAGGFLTAPPDVDDTMEDPAFTTAVLTRLQQPWTGYATPPAPQPHMHELHTRR